MSRFPNKYWFEEKSDEYIKGFLDGQKVTQEEILNNLTWEIENAMETAFSFEDTVKIRNSVSKAREQNLKDYEIEKIIDSFDPEINPKGKKKA